MGRAGEQACGAFKKCGDLSGYHLAQTHLAIHRVGAGHRPAPSELTVAVGTWGKERGSFQLRAGSRVARESGCSPLADAARVLRIEVVVHNTEEHRCGRSLEKFPEIVVHAKDILERLFL